MQLINWELASHPMNWIILFLFIFIAGFVLHLILANLPKVQTE